MTGQVEARLNELEIELPAPAAPAANYVPYIISGNQLFVSGQLPFGPDGLAITGKLGEDVDVATGRDAARLCAINVLAQAKAALGNLDRIQQCLKLGGFVNAVPDFTDHPKVVNGASDLLVAALGDQGRHTRFAVGCGSLPLGAPVEIDALLAFV